MSTLAVVGSRGFTDYALLCRQLQPIVKRYNIVRIISGGAKGADLLAETYARDCSLELEILKPDWSKYGRGAGMMRNTDIVNQADYVIAFWDGVSAGTRDSIRKAEKQSKLLSVIKY